MFGMDNKNGRKRGFFIVFEGISACGKSIKVEKMTWHFIHIGLGIPVVLEWNSNKTLRAFISFLERRKMLTARIYSLIQWFGFLLDYFTILLPSLRKDRVVIADRYVYTGIVRDWINGRYRFLGRIISALVKAPDILYFCKTAPEICYERICKRNKSLFYTNKQIKNSRLLKNKDLYYLKKMHSAYLKLMDDVREKKKVEVITLDWGEGHIEVIKKKENLSNRTELLQTRMKGVLT